MPTKAELISKAFSRLVRKELRADLKEIRRLNKEEYEEGVCATHDFCDANELMHDAFVSVMGEFHWEPEAALQADSQLWSEAWNLSKANEFRE